MPKVQIASDNFTRANGPIGSNWSASTGIAWTIASDQADGGTNAPGYIRWVGAGSFTPNQYAIVTIGPSVAVFAAAYLGCVLNDDGTNYYSIIVNSAGDYFIIKNGSNLAFAAAPILAVGDTLELDNVGGVITAYHNGTQFATVTDASPLTGGAPGMSCEYAGQAAFYSNWVGGNITSSPSGGPGTGAPPFGWVNTQGDHYNKRGLR